MLFRSAAGAFGSCPAATKSVGVTAAATTFDLAVDTTLSVTVKLDSDKSLTAATLTYVDGATPLTPTTTPESTGLYSVTGIAGTAAFVVTATVTTAGGDLTASSTSQAVTACKTLSPVTLFVK